jgi:hypothetical protein
MSTSKRHSSPNFICTDISSGQQDIFEQRAAVCFFTVYANDCLMFRDYISGAGIPFLVQAIKFVEDGPFSSNERRDIVRHVCRTLADLSILDWCIPIFARCIAVDNFLPLEFPVQTNTDRSF